MQENNEGRLLIEILAEREGRGHAELRRMAWVGVLKDYNGNPVTIEDLAYDGPLILPEDNQVEKTVSQVEECWQEYQRLIIKLRELSNIEDGQEAEWDRTDSCSRRVEESLMRVKNTQAHDDKNWAEQCFDQAHELCMDMKTYSEEIQDLISSFEDEDRS